MFSMLLPISARLAFDGLELRGPSGLTTGLVLRERQLWSTDGGPESGDESFDAVVVIEAADELLACAALDAEARRAGREAVALGAVLEGGRWTCLR